MTYFPPTSWVLQPSFFNKKKRKFSRSPSLGLIYMSPNYQYSAKEVRDLALKFRDLTPVGTRLAHAIRRQRHLEKQASLQKPS